MKFSDLPNFVILLGAVGILLGLFLIFSDELGDAARTNTFTEDEAVTFTAGNGTVTNTPLYSISSIINTSSGAYYNLGLVTSTTAGVITLENGSFNSAGSDILVNYTYRAISDATTSLNNSIAALGTISNTWLGLVITVAVLIMILAFMIRGLAGRAER